MRKRWFSLKKRIKIDWITLSLHSTQIFNGLTSTSVVFTCSGFLKFPSLFELFWFLLPPRPPLPRPLPLRWFPLWLLLSRSICSVIFLKSRDQQEKLLKIGDSKRENRAEHARLLASGAPDREIEPQFFMHFFLKRTIISCLFWHSLGFLSWKKYWEITRRHEKRNLLEKVIWKSFYHVLKVHVPGFSYESYCLRYKGWIKVISLVKRKINLLNIHYSLKNKLWSSLQKEKINCQTTLLSIYFDACP